MPVPCTHHRPHVTVPSLDTGPVPATCDTATGSTLDVVATFTAADLLLRLLGPPGTFLKGPRLAAASRLLSERTTV
jgi:hypothetical protein